MHQHQCSSTSAAAVATVLTVAAVHQECGETVHLGSTVSEYEGSVRSDHNRRGKSDAGQSWGEVLYYETPGVYEWQSDSRKADQLQDSKVAMWEAAVADCHQAMQQLQQAKGAQHNSTLPACTPEQALSQYHPSVALEFELQTQGAVEEAQKELERRHVPLRGMQAEYTQATQTRIAQWRDRAQQTMGIARQFGQAAVEAVGLLEAALHGGRLQDLDHVINAELAVLEAHHSVLSAALPCMSTCVAARDDRYNQQVQIETTEGRIKATEERKARLTTFINKIKGNERKGERKKSKKILLCNHATST